MRGKSCSSGDCIDGEEEDLCTDDLSMERTGVRGSRQIWPESSIFFRPFKQF